MPYGYGLALGVIGCILTVTVFFIAFLIYNYNQREELKKNPYYFGDDTV